MGRGVWGQGIVEIHGTVDVPIPGKLQLHRLNYLTLFHLRFEYINGLSLIILEP